MDQQNESSKTIPEAAPPSQDSTTMPTPPVTDKKDAQLFSSPRKAKTIVTAVTLILLYPLGLLFMWRWMKWPLWVKLIVTITPIIFLPLLLSMTLIAINPAKQFAQANDTKRQSDVIMLYNAIETYRNETGQLPASIIGTEQEQSINSQEADMCADLVPSYLVVLPVDPAMDNFEGITDCSNYDTGYTIVNENGVLTITAPSAELQESIVAPKETVR